MRIYVVILFTISSIICGCATTVEKPETPQSASESLLQSGWTFYCWKQQGYFNDDPAAHDEMEKDCQSELAKPHLDSCLSKMNNVIELDSKPRNMRLEIKDCMQKQGYELYEYLQIIN